MNAFVTGASGFTGSHLVRLLNQRGARVRALVRESSSRSLLEGLDYESVLGDLGALDDFGPLVDGVDVIFHVAAVYREAKLSDTVYRRVNVEATRRLAHAAATQGIPFVYCSTCGVHGEVSPPASEESPYNPGDIYQTTKVEAEKALIELRNEGLRLSILRPVGIYGPGDRRFLKLFRGVARGRFPMIGKGEVLYHLTHVEDVVRGLVRGYESIHEVEGEAFILAGSRYTTIRELVGIIAHQAGVAPPRLRLPAGPMLAAAALCEAVCRPLGIEPPLYPRRLDFFLKDRAFDITKAREKLGWEPQVSLEQGIQRTLEWYRQRGWL